MRATPHFTQCHPGCSHNATWRDSKGRSDLAWPHLSYSSQNCSGSALACWTFFMCCTRRTERL